MIQVSQSSDSAQYNRKRRKINPLKKEQTGCLHKSACHKQANYCNLYPFINCEYNILRKSRYFKIEIVYIEGNIDNILANFITDLT